MSLSQENTISSLDAYYAACIIILFVPMHQTERYSPSQINDYFTTILPRQGLKNSIQNFVVPVCWMENVLRSKNIKKSILRRGEYEHCRYNKFPTNNSKWNKDSLLQF